MRRRDVLMMLPMFPASAGRDRVKVTVRLDGRLARVWWEPRVVAEKPYREIMSFGRKGKDDAAAHPPSLRKDVRIRLSLIGIFPFRALVALVKVY
jgi:hypothetical protein